MLSDSALNQLRLHVDRQGKVRVDNSNREAYRELACAGLMIAGHSFTEGREAFYVFTDAGWERRHEFLARAKESA